MIVIGFIVIVMSVSMTDLVIVCVHRHMRVIMIVVARFAWLVIMAAACAVHVFGRLRDRELMRRAFLDAVLVFVVMMIVAVVVIVTGDEVRIARLLPENDAAREGEENESDAAQQHVKMKRLVQHVLEHRRLPEIQTQTDHTECAGQTDHAKLIGEIAIPFVMMMIVRMPRFMGVRVRLGWLMNVRMCVVGHRYTSFAVQAMAGISLTTSARFKLVRY